MKQPQRASKPADRAPGWHTFWKKHAKQVVIIVTAVVLLAAAGVLKLNSYLNKLSDQDFVAIEQAAENVMKNVGATKVTKYEYCRHRAPEEYSSVRLYCGMELATYIPYQSDAQAIEIAKTLERETKSLGQTTSHISELLANPHDAYTNLSVALKKPLPQKQCHFTIATGERGGKAASNIPDRTGRDLIGIAFYCSAEARKEYFPVISN